MDENNGTTAPGGPEPERRPEGSAPVPEPAAEPGPPAAPPAPEPGPPATPAPPPGPPAGQAPPAPPARPGPSRPAAPAGEKSKIVAGVLGILLGGLGVHKFYLGYTTEGLIMAVVWLLGWLTAGLVSFAVIVVGLIEGIIYLTKTDQDFHDTYVANKKAWF